MPEPTYYYEKEGTTAGPVPAAELVAQGVRCDTLVWAAGMDSWLAAGQVEGLTSLFAAVPPPLPTRMGPPPLPKLPTLVDLVPPVTVPASSPGSHLSPYMPAGYSLPLLGKFKDDRAIWAMDSQQRFGEFAPNADLESLHEWGYQPLKKYQFVLLDATGQPLLTLFKPRTALINPLQLAEIRVLDTRNQLLGTCRHNAFKALTRLLTIEDARGRELMALKLVSIGSRDMVLETSAGVVGRIRRSHAAAWTQLFLEHKHDRFELIFEPAAQEIHKSLGISAVVAAYLLVPSL